MIVDLRCRKAGVCGPRSWTEAGAAAQWVRILRPLVKLLGRGVVAGKASVDVELVALWVLHPHRVVIQAVGAQGSGGRGSEICQPPAFGVDSLHSDGEGDRTVGGAGAAAGVDV